MADPKWDDTEELVPTFDETMDVDSEEEDDSSSKMGAAQAAGIGAAQGATFGFADELAGAGSAGIDKLLQSVETFDPSKEDVAKTLSSPKAREILAQEGLPKEPRKDWSTLIDEYTNLERERLNRAKEEQPGATFAGELVGGALAPIPGGGAALAGAKTLGQGIKAGIKTGAIGGALYGAGVSEKDDVIERSLDAAEGAGIGVVAGAGIPLVGSAVKGAVKGGITFAEKLLGPVRQAAKVGYERPILSKEARQALGSDITKTGQQLGEDVIESKAQKAITQKEALGEATAAGNQVDIDNLIRQTKQQIKEIDPIGSTSKSDKQKLETLVSDYEKLMLPKVSDRSETELTQLKKNMADAVSSNTETFGLNRIKKIELKEAEEALARYSPKIEAGAAPDPNRIHNIKNSIDESIKSLKTSEGKKIANELASNVSEALNQGMEGTAYKESTEAISNINSALKQLGIKNPSELSPKQAMDAFVKAIGGEANEGMPSAKARQITSDFLGALQKGDEKLANKYSTEMKKLAEQAEVADALSGPIIGGFAGVKKGGSGIFTLGAHAGAAAGSAARKGKEAVKSASQAIFDHSPEQVQNMVSKLSQKSDRASQELAQILQKSIGSEHMRRKALIFGAMQQERFRNAINDTNNEEE